MTSNIKIGKYNVKPSSVTWKCSVCNMTDTCVIQLPLSTYTRTNGTTTEVAGEEAKGVVIQEGMKVEVNLGYDGNNTRRFAGYVNRVNYATPLKVECEGYSYPLRQIRFTRSYKQTTIKNILQDLISGTEIQLSKSIPNIPLTNVWFRDCPGIKVLEWFKNECGCNVWFDFDTLYVGAAKFGIDKGIGKLQLGWNTVKDDELKKTVSDTEIQINIVSKDSTGKKEKTKSTQKKYTSTREVKVRSGLPADYLNKIASELQNEENYKGYQGNVTCFLIPSFEKSMVCEITDKKFVEREGKYFVESIDGSFSSSGGRQKITLRHYGKI